MSLYVDSSAWMKRYVAEAETTMVGDYLRADVTWFTARHAWVEVRRNLARLLEGEPLHHAREAFTRDFRRTHVVELDTITCALAAEIAEVSIVRSLDALHLGALRRLGDDVPLLTFDIRQAQAARSLGIRVVGA